MSNRIDFLILSRDGKPLKEGFYNMNNAMRRKQFGKIVATAIKDGHIVVSGLATLPTITITPVKGDDNATQ